MEDSVPLSDYFEELGFTAKKPYLRSSRPDNRCGDNIYYRLNGRTVQLENDEHEHGQDDERHDLSGVNALITGC